MSFPAQSPGRGVVLRRPALAGAVLGLVMLGGCAVGGDHVDATSPEPRADLAERAEISAKNQAASAQPGASSRGRDRGTTGSGVEESVPRGERPGVLDTVGPSARSGEGSPQAGRGSGKHLARLEDPAGDHGSGPGYADLTGVELGEADGKLAVSIEVDSTVPGALAHREVEGVGIDLFRSGSQESDYQVFLDGGDDGWRAFLQTPDGFVDFPGLFGLSDHALYVFMLPWDSVGGRRDAEVSVFVDWSSGSGRVSTDRTARMNLSPS